MRYTSLALACATFAQTALGQIAGPKPVNIGFLLFPGYQAIDTWGPIDLINILSWKNYLNFTILTSDGLPVSTFNPVKAVNMANSTVQQWVIPDASFANAPPLDVLFIPGGLGNRLPTIAPTIEYVRKVYPSLQYLVTICTGSGIAARAGVLDGKNATTNKWAFYEMANHGPKTWWHSSARWVVDGNIWTSSGVSAGIDVTLAWISHVWGFSVAEGLANGMEYDWHKDASWDPFSLRFNISDVINGVTLPVTPRTTPTPTPSSVGSCVTVTSVSTTTATVVVTPTSSGKTTKSSKTAKTTKTAKATTTKRW